MSQHLFIMSSQNFDVLLNLPTDLVCSVLSEWVDLKGLSAVDVAFCNHKKRPFLLTTISSEQFVFREVCPVHTNSISWMTKRSIRHSKCCANGNMLDFLEYVKEFGPYVELVTIIRPQMEENGIKNMAKALLHCVSLKSLEVLHAEVCQELLDAISSCSSIRELRVVDLEPSQDEYPSLTANNVAPLQLTTLSLEDEGACHAEILEMASPPALQALGVSLSEDFGAKALCKYLSAGCNLKALRVTGEMFDDDLISFLNLCPNITHLEIDCYHLTEDCIPQLATLLSRSHLEVLRLSNGSFMNPMLTALAAQGCDSLRFLFFDEFDVGSNEINDIARQCTGLTQLRFRLHSEEHLRRIDWFLLSNLTHIMLEWHHRSFNVDANAALNCVANHCSKLTYLAMSDHLSNKLFDFSTLFDKAVLPALSILNMRVFSDNDASMLQMHRPNLRVERTEPNFFEKVVRGDGHSIWNNGTEW